MKIKGSHVTDRWGSYIEIKGIDSTSVLELHRSTREDLTHTINDQGSENMKLSRVGLS